jgi:hypothetical protein
LASLRDEDFAASPAPRQYADAALPALPAVGQRNRRARRDTSRAVIAADCPRALNEFVGLSDSSLM